MCAAPLCLVLAALDCLATLLVAPVWRPGPALRPVGPKFCDRLVVAVSPACPPLGLSLLACSTLGLTRLDFTAPPLWRVLRRPAGLDTAVRWAGHLSRPCYGALLSR